MTETFQEPTLRLPHVRFTTSQMMATIVILGVLFAMYIPTLRWRVDWTDPRLDGLVVTGFLMFGETVVVYYVVLILILLFRNGRQSMLRSRIGRRLLAAPVLLVAAIILLLEILDRVLHR